MLLNDYRGWTDEDVAIAYWRVGRDDAYSNAICDRNDYAIMRARTMLAQVGCRATRDRVMPPESQ